MAYWMSGVLHDPKGELTEAPELPDVVAFNIADGAFEFFTGAQFEAQVAQWRDELYDSGDIDDDVELDDEEVIDMVNGDEFFWDWLPKEVK
jgi:hypothetical protein